MKKQTQRSFSLKPRSLTLTALIALVIGCGAGHLNQARDSERAQRYGEAMLFYAMASEAGQVSSYDFTQHMSRLQQQLGPDRFCAELHQVEQIAGPRAFDPDLSYEEQQRWVHGAAMVDSYGQSICR